jgi:uncharacterized membrane protein
MWTGTAIFYISLHLVTMNARKILYFCILSFAISWCEICYSCLSFQLLLAQPVTNPTTASSVVTPTSVLPSAAAAVDHKADESQVFALLIAIALFSMSLLESVLEQPPPVLLKCGDCTCVGLWQRSKKYFVK